jgi:hypothetical protein
MCEIKNLTKDEHFLSLGFKVWGSIPYIYKLYACLKG